MRKQNQLNTSLTPLLPLTMSLIIGIVCCRYLHVGLWGAVLLAVLIAATLLTRRWPAVQSAACCLCFGVLGITIAPEATERDIDGRWTEAVVASVPADRPKTLMVELLLPTAGEQRRCYIWKDSASRRLALGDNIEIRLRDGQFVGSSEWHRGGTARSRLSSFQRLRLKAQRWRSTLLDRLPADSSGDARAVMAAMTLGDKSMLTSEVRDLYNSTGAAHVLALSGLHLSIIYMLLTLLVPRNRRYWLVQVLTVVAIWLYALLTGLPTSIIRAATMISVYSLFAISGRQHAPLNILCFTAMLMLIVDSSAISDVGFQLSFMAMAGILLFMPVADSFFSMKWMISHPVVHWLYGLMAVSIAAQLGTAPLVAYYFGRLTPWFLLTNIVVVPLATLILGGTLLTLAVPAVGTAVVWLVSRQNDFLDTMTSLPLATIDGLRPSVIQVLMVYVIIAALYVILVSRPAFRSRNSRFFSE